MILTTEGGRRLDVADPERHWRYGRSVYRVAGVGAFTLGWGGKDNPHCWYGAVPEGRGESYTPEPEAPAVFGITLIGGASIHWDHYDDRHIAERNGVRYNRVRWFYWMAHPHRPRGRYCSEAVPDGTWRRTAEIVGALLEHWREEPDHPALYAHYLSSQAPGRINGATRDMRRLREEIATRAAQLDELAAHSAFQRALILHDPLAPYRVGDIDPTRGPGFADDPSCCRAPSPAGDVCTWDTEHAGPHVAGILEDGAFHVIGAVWPNPAPLTLELEYADGHQSR